MKYCNKKKTAIIGLNNKTKDRKRRFGKDNEKKQINLSFKLDLLA